MSDITIKTIGGNCPVQAEGTIDGHEFYFRARWSRWSIGIGGDVVGDPCWYYEEPYGEGEFDAGWMEQDEAREFIDKAAGLFRKRWKTSQLRKKHPWIEGHSEWSEHLKRYVFISNSTQKEIDDALEDLRGRPDGDSHPDANRRSKEKPIGHDDKAMAIQAKETKGT